MSHSAQLFYVADPMCSWCWGFREALEGLERELREGIELELVLGGLAADDESPMEPSTRIYVQNAWRAVEAATGAQFNHAFWTDCQPRRSTWPACRAVLAAEEQVAGLGRRMFAAIQRAYYLEARNPSDVQTLVELATELGIRAKGFSERLNSREIRNQLDQDIARCKRLGVDGYPSLVLESETGVNVLTRGYVDPQALHAQMREQGLLADSA